MLTDWGFIRLIGLTPEAFRAFLAVRANSEAVQQQWLRHDRPALLATRGDEGHILVTPDPERAW